MAKEITLSYGSGGKLTHKLIRDFFQKYFDFEELIKEDDGGIFFTKEGKYVISTDSYVVDPIFFPGGNIGTLSISGTINDLASMGAEPICLSVSFVFEEGFYLEELERIISSMASLLKREKVPIIAADTKVIERRQNNKPGVFINTTGIGKIYKDIFTKDSIEPGDLIVINGPIGEHGFSVLTSRLGFNSESQIISDAKPLWDLVKRVIEKVSVKFMRDPTRGGLVTTLNEIVEGKDLGILIYEEDLPVSDKVKGVSELLGIDPLEVANEGKMVFVIPKEESEKALSIMKDHPDGREARIIGEITQDYKGKVILINSLGTKRILDMPSGEQLPRIC